MHFFNIDMLCFWDAYVYFQSEITDYLWCIWKIHLVLYVTDMWNNLIEFTADVVNLIKLSSGELTS